VRQNGAPSEHLRLLAEGSHRKRRRRRRKKSARPEGLPQLPELDGETSQSDRGLSSACMSFAEEGEPEVEAKSTDASAKVAMRGLRRSQSAGVVASKAFSAGAGKLAKAFSRDSLASVEDSLAKTLTARAGRLARAFSREAHESGDEKSPKIGVAGKFVRVFTRESLTSGDDAGRQLSARSGKMAKAFSMESFAYESTGSRSAGTKSGLPLLPRSLASMARANIPGAGGAPKPGKLRILRDFALGADSRSSSKDDGASRGGGAPSDGLRGAFSRSKSRSSVSTGSGGSSPASFPSSHGPSQGVSARGPPASPSSR